MAKKINIVGKKAERIRNTGPSLPRIESSEFAATIGAEPCGERQDRFQTFVGPNCECHSEDTLGFAEGKKCNTA